MGWTHIPDLEYSPASRTDNPWVGHRAQPVGKVSVDLPPEDWLCRKLETLNLVLLEGYPSKSSEPGGMHVDQFLRPPKSQTRGYGIHPAEPKDLLRPENQSTPGPMMRPNSTVPFPGSVSLLLLTLIHQAVHLLKTSCVNGEKSAKETSYVCNQSAGFNHCITKIQDSVQENLKTLQTELPKGKSSGKAKLLWTNFIIWHPSTRMLASQWASHSSTYLIIFLYRWLTLLWLAGMRIWTTSRQG